MQGLHCVCLPGMYFPQKKKKKKKKTPEKYDSIINKFKLVLKNIYNRCSQKTRLTQGFLSNYVRPSGMYFVMIFTQKQP